MSNKKTRYEYEEGQKIYFNIDGKTKGWGYIRGCAGDYPTIGKQWVVEADKPHPYDATAYPFSCISAFSVQIRLQPFELDGNPLVEKNEPPTSPADTKAEADVE